MNRETLKDLYLGMILVVMLYGLFDVRVENKEAFGVLMFILGWLTKKDPQ